jgi:hypothetical protein
MKSPQITSGRQTKVTAGWTQGVNSVRNPWALPENQVKWAVNAQFRGGIAQTRPGQTMRLSLPPGNFQGGILFLANKQYKAADATTSTQIYGTDGNGVEADEIPYIVFAVNGKVYWSPFPLTQPKSWSPYQLTGVSLDPNVNQFVFALATQSANISTGGDVSVTPSHRVLFIQDGVNPPAYWDGSNTTGTQTSNIPTGTWMAFSGNRLWIANKNIVLASDLGDPTSWQERTTGTGRGDFSFARSVTALVNYVGQNNDQKLYVFTDRATYSLSSGIYDRTIWTSTPNFQTILFPNVGCIAGKSIAFQAGQMWWYSQGGLISADVAGNAYLSSQVLYKDVEMVRAKAYMAGNQTGICATSFENYLLYSIPYLEPLNAATMVMDWAAAAEMGQSRSPAWCGVWTGTRPVEWTTGIVNGQPRCFHFSVDYSATNDGSYISLWESFMPNRVDTYLNINPDGSTTELFNRIYSQVETALLGDGMDWKQFVYSELECCEIGGTVDVKASYRGSKGQYQSILDTRVLAVTEDYQWQDTPFATEIEKLGFLNTQYRRLITESATRNATAETCESYLTTDIDKGFSMLVEWCGEFGVEAIRMFQDPWSERSTGIPQSNEKTSCVLAQDGSTLTLDLLPNPYENPNTSQQSWYAKVYRTVTLTCGNSSPSISATAAASFLSSVSFTHAEEQAGILAQNAANAAAQQYRSQHPC